MICSLYPQLSSLLNKLPWWDSDSSFYNVQVNSLVFERMSTAFPIHLKKRVSELVTNMKEEWFLKFAVSITNLIFIHLEDRGDKLGCTFFHFISILIYNHVWISHYNFYFPPFFLNDSIWTSKSYLFINPIIVFRIVFRIVFK